MIRAGRAFPGLRVTPEALCGALVILLSFATAPVLAAPDEPGEDSETLQIVIKNVKNAEGKLSGCYFELKGKLADPLDDGAHLQVTLQARGRSQDFPIKVLRGVVKDNTYEVSAKWPNRVFAPLLYEVKVVLNVRLQGKKVQRWIMQEYGYAVTHQEIVDRKRFGFGTDEERATFAVENIDRFMGFVRQLETVRVEVAAAAEKPAAETPEWADLETSLNNGIISFRDDLDAYFKYYVVLLEQGFYNRILSSLKQLARIIRDHGRNIPGIAARLDLLGQSLAATIELIREHSPATHEEALVPDDEEEESGGGDEEQPTDEESK